MSETFAKLVSLTRDWFEHTHADGWLTPRDLERFASVEQRTPADLFADSRHRPLVVAFFGGTGVGKSSLLNRLAGETIARTGVERPTSREVTIYLHEDVELAALPPELPVEHVRVQRHSAGAAGPDQPAVLWIDAPDIDSTHEDNRKLALAWLPYIDLLIYVVSPERYRDDVGWRILLDRGQKHGWMFVLNRWDEGDRRQKDDFARMLRQAGFNDPLLLPTCCLDAPPPLPSPDEFPRIEAAIRALLAEHGERELERLGQRARLLELRESLNAARKQLGDEEQWKHIDASWQRHWQRTRSALEEGSEWPIRAAASRLAVRERGLLAQVVKTVAAGKLGGAQAAARAAVPRPRTLTPAPETEDDPGTPDTVFLSEMLWDDWTQDKLTEALDAIELELRRLGIAAQPARTRLDAEAQKAGVVVLQNVRNRLRAALARPGTLLQRTLRRVTGFLTAFLPLIALLWVAYNVVRGYYQASRGAASYLGTDFAVSSVLLVAIAWAVPFVCDRLLRPSLERTALRALREGLADGLAQLADQLHGALAEAGHQAEAHRTEAKRIFAEISRLALRPLDVSKATLAPLLATPARALTPADST
jgi:hypothetical protein